LRQTPIEGKIYTNRPTLAIIIAFITVSDGSSFFDLWRQLPAFRPGRPFPCGPKETKGYQP
jgi:hypothetical protein